MNNPSIPSYSSEYMDEDDFVAISFDVSNIAEMEDYRQTVHRLVRVKSRHFVHSTEEKVILFMPEEIADLLEIPAKRVSINELLKR